MSRHKPHIKVYPTKYIYHPVLMDVIDQLPRSPATGTICVKVQPPMTPKNGTMGHCYAAPVDNVDEWFLCHENSLEKP